MGMEVTSFHKYRNYGEMPPDYSTETDTLVEKDSEGSL